MIKNFKLKIKNSHKGFTLVELLVAILIFSIIVVAIVAVFVSTVTSYGKAKAIKTVKENAEFAMSSIAKDVRMGRIDDPSGNYSNGFINQYLMITRNRGGKVCYYLDRTSGYLGIIEGVAEAATECPNPLMSTYSRMVDLSGTGMNFTDKTGFYSCTSAVKNPAPCGISIEKRRGWVEINLNISMVSGKEMESDKINVQTVVSSRDYGWEDVEP